MEVPVTEARAAFSELINKVGYGGERVIITRHGKPLVALVPADHASAEGEAGETEPVAVLDMTSTATRSTATGSIAARHVSDPQVRE